MRRLVMVALCLTAGYLIGRIGSSGVRRSDLVLTARQREILSGVSRGLTDKEIGARLGMAQTTVKTHLRRLREETGAPNRAALAALVGQLEPGAPSSPRGPAIPVRAVTTSATRSSNGIPRSAAPASIISRLTARAKPLSFIFFRTAAASTSATRLLGRTSATAVTNPETSSTA